MDTLDKLVIGSLQLVLSLSVVPRQRKERDVIAGFPVLLVPYIFQALCISLQPTNGRTAALTPIWAEGHSKANS